MFVFDSGKGEEDEDFLKEKVEGGHKGVEMKKEDEIQPPDTFMFDESAQ